MLDDPLLYPGRDGLEEAIVERPGAPAPAVVVLAPDQPERMAGIRNALVSCGFAAVSLNASVEGAPVDLMASLLGTVFARTSQTLGLVVQEPATGIMSELAGGLNDLLAVLVLLGGDGEVLEKVGVPVERLRADAAADEICRVVARHLHPG